MSTWTDDAWWDDLRGCSLSQPWCWAVVDEIARKWIENRSWQPPIAMIGKAIAIHAAQSWDKNPVYRSPKGYLVTPSSYLLELGLAPPMRYDDYPKGDVVGIAVIDRIVTKPDTLPADQQRWFFGPFGWVLTSVTKITRPIPCKGKQGLWRVPAPVVTEMREQLRRAA